MTDYTADAKRHRDQAKECRAKADLVADESTHAQYLRMSEAFDQMADHEEQMARSTNVMRKA